MNTNTQPTSSSSGPSGPVIGLIVGAGVTLVTVIVMVLIGAYALPTIIVSVPTGFLVGLIAFLVSRKPTKAVATTPAVPSPELSEPELLWVNPEGPRKLPLRVIVPVITLGVLAGAFIIGALGLAVGSLRAGLVLDFVSVLGFICFGFLMLREGHEDILKMTRKQGEALGALIQAIGWPEDDHRYASGLYNSFAAVFAAIGEPAQYIQLGRYTDPTGLYAQLAAIGEHLPKGGTIASAADVKTVLSLLEQLGTVDTSGNSRVQTPTYLRAATEASVAELPHNIAEVVLAKLAELAPPPAETPAEALVIEAEPEVPAASEELLQALNDLKYHSDKPIRRQAEDILDDLTDGQTQGDDLVVLIGQAMDFVAEHRSTTEAPKAEEPEELDLSTASAETPPPGDGTSLFERMAALSRGGNADAGTSPARGDGTVSFPTFRPVDGKS